MSKPSFHLAADAGALAGAVRDLIAQLAQEAVRQRGRFTLALSGGSTPRRTYEALARTEGLPFHAMHFFFGDERHVPPTHAESNYRMAKEALFDVARIPAENIHRVPAEQREAAAAASAYEEMLRAFFGEESPPRFDVQLLGLGNDGHTASLFPGTPGIHETRRWVMSQWVEKLKTDRITLTPPVHNASRAVLFVVQGADKAPAVHEVLEGAQSVDQIPARVVHPDPGGVFWFLDEPAAAQLSKATLGRKATR